MDKEKIYQNHRLRYWFRPGAPSHDRPEETAGHALPVCLL